MDQKKYLLLRSRIKVEKPHRLIGYHYLTDLCFIGVIVLCAWAQWEFVAILPVAIVMFRNFSLMHDAVHKAVSSHRGLNDGVGELAGCLCFLPFETWKRSHLEHHLWSGNIEKDPVMALRVNLPKASHFLQDLLTVCWRLWVPTLAVLQYVLFWVLSFRKTIQDKSIISILRLIGPILFWTAVFALSSSKMIYLGLVPGMLLYFIAVEVVNFPHHLQLPMTEGEMRYPIWQQYKSSRTCIYPRWFARFFVLNFNYHVEHHMFPDIPWHMLDQIHDLVRAELGTDLNLDTNLSWILQNRSKSLLEVIEPVGFKEAA